MRSRTKQRTSHNLLTVAALSNSSASALVDENACAVNTLARVAARDRSKYESHSSRSKQSAASNSNFENHQHLTPQKSSCSNVRTNPSKPPPYSRTKDVAGASHQNASRVARTLSRNQSLPRQFVSSALIAVIFPRAALPNERRRDAASNEAVLTT